MTALRAKMFDPEEGLPGRKELEKPMRSFRELLEGNPGWKEAPVGERGGVNVTRVVFAERRDLSAGGNAGFLVGDVKSPTYAESVHGDMRLEVAGTQLLTVDEMPTNIPREATPPTFSWLAAGQPVPDGDPAFERVSLSMKTGAAGFDVSRNILVDPQNADFLLRSGSRALAAGVDAAVFSGGGVAGQMTGIPLVTGVDTGSGASYDPAKWAAQLKSLEDARMDTSKAVAVASTDVAAALRTRAINGTGSAFMVTGDASGERMFTGHRFLVSSGVSSGTIILGVFEHLRVYTRAIEIVRNVYTQKKSGVVEFYFFWHGDSAVTNPAAFSVRTSVT